mmetsp:Transcript_42165/g.164825  ORF Transcript_42165/g.164825 Transcript_42165/m.164825 type:complete len:173 (+) Transcript_42165:180-698(+)
MAAFAVGGGGIGGSRFVGQRAELCKVERRSQTLGAGGSGRVSMIAAFGPHRWEVGKEYEEDYIYQYLIPIPENLHDVTMFDIDMQNLDFSSFKGRQNCSKPNEPVLDLLLANRLDRLRRSLFVKIPEAGPFPIANFSFPPLDGRLRKSCFCHQRRVQGHKKRKVLQTASGPS